MRPRRTQFVLIALLFALAAHAQNFVRSVRMVPGPEGPSLEIVTTRPLTPDITLVENPIRLVIDLNHAVLPAAMTIAFRNDAITGVRANQYQSVPAVARIVIDLSQPVGYSWDAAGNRLMVRLRSHPIQTQAATAATSLAAANSSSGAALTSKSGVAGGSAVSAGAEVAVMKLPRGGEVHVCPGTTVSVAYSPSGRDLMLGMSTGALETDYSLGAAADSILTPDFRILMAGPGDFHFAISADSRGNTCVRSLPGNTAAVIVSELMGDQTYQVKPAEQAFFRAGRLANPSNSVPPECGCPINSPPAMQTAGTSASPGASMPAAPHVAVADPGIADLPPPDKNAVQVSVDAPFVFHGNDPPPAAAPAPTKEAASLALTYALPPEPMEVTVLPPPPVAAQRGFFGKMKGFFSTLFGGK